MVFGSGEPAVFARPAAAYQFFTYACQLFRRVLRASVFKSNVLFLFLDIGLLLSHVTSNWADLHQRQNKHSRGRRQGRQPFYPARGPQGPELAVSMPEAFSPLRRRRGAAAPAADHRVPSKSSAFVRCFLLFPFFDLVWEDWGEIFRANPGRPTLN